jgi:hypothetical protein
MRAARVLPLAVVAVMGRGKIRGVRRGRQARLAAGDGVFTRISLRRGTVKTFIIICGGVDLTTATFPLVVDCGGGYTDDTFSGPVPPADPKAWGAGSGLSVTFRSFDGTRASGTFQGCLAPGDTNPGDPPASFQGGKFTVPLINGGP